MDGLETVSWAGGPGIIIGLVANFVRVTGVSTYSCNAAHVRPDELQLYLV